MGPQKFIAANTAEALKLIREHLGPDAMVLSTKDTHEGDEGLKRPPHQCVQTAESVDEIKDRPLNGLQCF